MKPLNVAIVGFGKVAEEAHLPAYMGRDDLLVTSVVDPCARRRLVARRLVPDLSVYESLPLLLRSSSVRPDLIDVCSPPMCHAGGVKIALAAGSHVLCEKPLARTVKEYNALVRRARTQGLLLYPCHNYKFASEFVEASRLIDNGAIGTLLSATVLIHRTGSALGTADWEPHWRRDPKMAGGGIWTDHGPHVVYVLCRLLGDQPTRIRSTSLAWEASNQSIETAVEVEILYGRILARVSLSWNAVERRTTYDIVGSEGRIRIEGGLITVKRDRRIERVILGPSSFDDPSHRSWFRLVLEDLVGCLAEMGRSSEALVEGRLVAGALEGAYLSANQGNVWIDVGDPDGA